MSKQKFSGKAALWLIVALLVVVGAAVVAWGGSQIFPLQIPFEAPWASSGHADGAAEAFAHWDLDVPPEIPTRCAKCHSGLGYLDFLGVDGT